MAYNKKTFKIKADSSKGVWLDATNTGINEASGYVSEIPNLWISDSFELIIDAYEENESSATHDFGADSIAKLYIKKRNSIAEATCIDSDGTVTQLAGTGAYYIITFDVPANTISTLNPSLAGEDCILYAEVTPTVDSDESSSSTEDVDESNKTTFAQNITLIDANGDLSADSRYNTSDFPIFNAIVTASSTLTAYPGRAIYLVNAGSGITITLPSTTIYKNQEIEIMNIGSYNVIVAGATGGNVTLSSSDTGHFIAFSGTWYQAVYPIID